MLSILHHVVDGGHLFLHEEAEHLVVGVEVVGNHGCRSVLAVSGAKSIIDIDICIGGQLLGEFLLTLLHLSLSCIVFRSTLLHTDRLAFLFRIEAKVLQQKSLSRLQSGSLSVSIAGVFGKLYVDPKSLAHIAYDL